MSRRAIALSALAVSKLGRDGFHPVGEVPGLGLHIAGEARSWLLRFSFAGRRPEMGLGSFPEVSLALARQKARDARELVRQGINPIDAKGRPERRKGRARRIEDVRRMRREIHRDQISEWPTSST
jgi:hypothetical protein